MRISSLLTSAALVSASLAAQADTAYLYSGPTFTEVSDPFTTSDSISGSVTFTSPLAANLNEAAFAPSFTFNDGVDTFTSANTVANSSSFLFSTDASGNITQFEFEVQDLFGSQLAASTSESLSYATSLSSGIESFGANSTSAGSFSSGVSTITSVTPEPSSLGLLATGMLGLMGVAKRRLG